MEAFRVAEKDRWVHGALHCERHQVQYAEKLKPSRRPLLKIVNSLQDPTGPWVRESVPFGPLAEERLSRLEEAISPTSIGPW